MQNNYPVLKPKNTLNEHFATALIVPYYQLQFVIVHCVWHWQLTNMHQILRKRADWLFDCLYRLSKLVEIQMINRISKTIYSRTHTP